HDAIPIFEKSIQHHVADLSNYRDIIKQHDFRKKVILDHLDYEGISITKLDAVCARGGLVRPIEGGTYLINEAMLEDLRSETYGKHVSNLGGLIAYEIACGLNISAYIVDPLVVEEFDDNARYNSVPDMPRKSIFHVLTQKYVARQAADGQNKTYDDLSLILAYKGEGITIGIHHRGKLVDVN